MKTLSALTLAAGLAISLAPAVQAQSVLQGFEPTQAQENAQAPVKTGRSLANRYQAQAPVAARQDFDPAGFTGRDR